MKILQLNLNHCEATHDLLMQNVHELKIGLAIISEPYKHIDTQQLEMDSSAKAVIRSCGKLQKVIKNTKAVFVAAKVENVYFYSCYTSSSFSFEEFLDFLERLTQDANQYSPVVIAGDFNAMASSHDIAGDFKPWLLTSIYCLKAVD
ncbi:hypothetical protein HELRODRAFT_179156 [Helobdella robusta]|uniref:Endonuclease/exonuclease/phosphatase domain-containing protein n=1 Tax=Helobdella robusta TaxID=6412 RepID=T1FE99_HELRO|nr:hypothetical protein HELRODRAFT_179156 [Helobdella robusta]ESN95685.1 hypothetical protein HELRODRAFT_179156 [Helobdella robusta]